MATGIIGDQARFQQRQVINTWRRQINWNDAGNGTNVAGVVLPIGAFICGVFIEIVTAFDGGAQIIAGTNAGANNVIATGDATETGAGVTEVTRGYGRSLTAASDVTLNTRLTSTAGTVGQAEILVYYEANTG